MNKLVFSVNEIDEGTRIDAYLAAQSDGLSRSYIQKIIESGGLTCNGRAVAGKYKVRIGDDIELEVPDNTVPEILPEDIPLDVIYEDSDVIVVNKPKGMVVHPATGHFSGTLVNALMYHCKDLSGINGVLRPGIVHRIDMDTSGLLICAKNDFAHSSLAEQFKVHSITRRYRAITVGNFKDLVGTIEGNIGRSSNERKLMAIVKTGGRSAVTHYKVLENFAKNAYVECILDTGRTHQIRVHMKSINHPLIGDTVYGGRLSEFKLNGEPVNGQVLHAKDLGFVHPRTGEYMEFTSELPDYFNQILAKLRS